MLLQLVEVLTNGLPFSLSMGCGTWQKNTIDNNLNYKHFINTTKISTTIKGNEPKLKDFFEEYCQKYHKEENKKFRLMNEVIFKYNKEIY